MKKIKNSAQLKKKVEDIEAALPHLPYGWQIGIHGDLYKTACNDFGVACYQQDEAERLVKALHEFYFPEEEI